MGKFYGAIGYAETSEVARGVYENTITEKKYSGDVLRNVKNWQAGETLNDDVVLSNKISIIADLFAYENFQTIRYVTWMGASWEVKSIEILRPRIILTIGGVYNGPMVAPEPEGGTPADP